MSDEVTLAVKMAIATIEPISPKIAIMRLPELRRPISPIERCVVAAVAHNTPVLKSLAALPPMFIMGSLEQPDHATVGVGPLSNASGRSLKS